MAERSDRDTQDPGLRPRAIDIAEACQYPDLAPCEVHAETDLHFPSTPSSEHERDALEATELARLRRNYSRASSYHHQASSNVSSRQPTTPIGHLAYVLSKFWRHQISVTVPHVACRDHLALERTFLGYLRTSLALSMIGILVAQLFRLQHTPSPDPRFGFYVLGKPLSCICQGAAFCTTAIGAFRSWRTQNAMVRGKALTGGFEIILLALGILLIMFAFFVLILAIDVMKEHIN